MALQVHTQTSKGNGAARRWGVGRWGKFGREKKSSFFFLRHRRCENVCKDRLEGDMEKIILPLLMAQKSGDHQLICKISHLLRGYHTCFSLIWLTGKSPFSNMRYTSSYMVVFLHCHVSFREGISYHITMAHNYGCVSGCFENFRPVLFDTEIDFTFVLSWESKVPPPMPPPPNK